uniref:Uncharacterized protein n=2 Tax=Triticum urartu TaxID=4572 RepID=A0A8R7UHR4_TRIUA
MGTRICPQREAVDIEEIMRLNILSKERWVVVDSNRPSSHVVSLVFLDVRLPFAIGMHVDAPCISFHHDGRQPGLRHRSCSVSPTLGQFI